MAFLNITTGLGTSLTDILMADDVIPGSDPSYQLCKAIYTYHPLGKKLADAPVTLAQSQEREIVVADAPEDVVKKFLEGWEEIKATSHIFNLASLSRVYGAAALVMLVDGVKPEVELDLKKIGTGRVKFNILDPLNVAGSLVLDLDPNSFNFLSVKDIVVQGRRYDRARTIVMFNEKPIYLDYTVSAFGYVGRSVYQRCLYPLKSFLRTMIADDMVARKAGLLVAKMKPPGSIIDGMMTSLFGLKRRMLQDGQTDNVLGIDTEESIETLNMQNVNGAMQESRKDIINNIAVACDMPAIVINSETYVAGFGEGTEDAKNVARFVGGVRGELKEAYDFFDTIVMHRAWTPEFFAEVSAKYPDQFGGRDYDAVFQEWRNKFRALWPSLIEEPESERSKVDDVKLKAIVAMVQVLSPSLDPENKTELIKWAVDNFNELERLFSIPLNLDYEALAEYTPPEASQEGDRAGIDEPKMGKPFADAQTLGGLIGQQGLARVLELVAKADANPVQMHKTDVNYSSGTAMSHCGICEHFVAPQRCSRVGGYIRREAWCKLFEERTLEAAD